jgi:phage terminase large subunit GpA-like protein
MTSSQVGKTLIVKTVLGYHIDQDPCPILVLQPSLDMAETFSKDRFAPMIRDTPVLRDKIKDPRSRDSNNTILKKNFPGGHLTMVGANSPTGLSARPIRIVVADEVDRFPMSAGTEGDPLSLALKRTSSFHNRKYLTVSTPTDEGRSRIEKDYLLSDQRKYKCPCPECGHKQELVFDNLKWENKNPETAHMVCNECGVVIEESQKAFMVHNGEWVATNPLGKFHGFHISALYLLWVRWADIVEEFYEKKDQYETLKVFWNTTLGLPFANRGESPEWEKIYDLRESYEVNSIPEPVRFLTASCDVQKNRIEIEVKGWGRDGQSWSIVHDVLPGDSALDRVDDYLNKTWLHPSGNEIRIGWLGIDTGGDKTQQIYDWCRKHPNDRVFALKGASNLVAVAVGIPKDVDVNYKGKKIYNGVKLWPVGVGMIKSEFYNRLQYRPLLDESGEITGYPPGYCHYPEYPPEWFKQMTAESLRWVIRQGRKVALWEKIPGQANEALDLNVYNRAMSIIAGIDRLSSKEWDAIDEQFKHGPKPERVNAQNVVYRRRQNGKINL